MSKMLREQAALRAFEALLPTLPVREAARKAVEAADVFVAAFEGKPAPTGGGGHEAPAKGQAEAKAAPSVATDEDLDGPYGNPEVRFDPKRWKGPSYVGQKFSDCPSDYLECFADFADWLADKRRQEGDEKKAGYAARDASRARGWAKRNNGQGKPAAGQHRTTTADEEFGRMPPPDDAAAIDDIPF